MDGVAGRRHRPPDTDNVMAKPLQTVTNFFAGPILDVVLQFVDLVMDAVHEVEERLCNVVHDVIGDHPRGEALPTHIVYRTKVQRLSISWRPAHRHQEASGQNEANFLVVDAVLIRHVHWHKYHAEDIFAVTLQPGPGIVEMDVRPNEVIHRLGVQRACPGLPDHRLVGVEKIDPFNAKRDGSNDLAGPALSRDLRF